MGGCRLGALNVTIVAWWINFAPIIGQDGPA
jgi:hypothetical protein